MSAITAPPDVALREAYSATGSLWQAGPGRVYDRLADELVAHSPRPLTGARVVDVGAGTGAATRAALRAGAAEVVALDVAAGMLAGWAPGGTAVVVGDAAALPLATASVDAVLAAFTFNHVAAPERAFAEAFRVLRPGGVVIAGSYAADDDHPVKRVVERVLAEHGWTCPAWYATVKADRVPQLACAAGCAAAARSGGFQPRVDAVHVRFDDLAPTALVEWRLGMAHAAPFVGALDPRERAALASEAVRRLGAAPPLIRSILVTRAVRG